MEVKVEEEQGDGATRLQNYKLSETTMMPLLSLYHLILLFLYADKYVTHNVSDFCFCIVKRNLNTSKSIICFVLDLNLGLIEVWVLKMHW